MLVVHHTCTRHWTLTERDQFLNLWLFALGYLLGVVPTCTPSPCPDIALPASLQSTCSGNSDEQKCCFLVKPEGVASQSCFPHTSLAAQFKTQSASTRFQDTIMMTPEGLLLGDHIRAKAAPMAASVL